MAGPEKSHLETRDMGAMPGPGSGKMNPKLSYDDFTVKYLKVDVDDAGDMLQMSNIQTLAMKAKPGTEEIVLLSEEKFTFMDKYFIVVKYLERNNNASR